MLRSSDASNDNIDFDFDLIPDSMRLDAYEEQRSVPIPTIADNRRATIPLTFAPLQCPVCLCLIQNAHGNIECLHRFCEECITSAVRMGPKQCPSCRGSLPTRRSLRHDSNLDQLVAAMYGDHEQFEKQQNEYSAEQIRRKQAQTLVLKLPRREKRVARGDRQSSAASSASSPRQCPTPTPTAQQIPRSVPRPLSLPSSHQPSAGVAGSRAQTKSAAGSEDGSSPSGPLPSPKGNDSRAPSQSVGGLAYRQFAFRLLPDPNALPGSLPILAMDSVTTPGTCQVNHILAWLDLIARTNGELDMPLQLELPEGFSKTSTVAEIFAASRHPPSELLALYYTRKGG
ncbi:hypothetical protein CAOG_00371 [Capsaspora owczarzaki ATCC 30864]|uniref:hypothetical protein n=1 Tax=Capsaspora owczarzaki (strain ATCC 30864) TaxID=595528 RepID=UPI000352192B|nr:hypothetical protein CAOG_00371 [Capsaspora owczarzaki ATCC 30864]|eukprot:XP_004365242.2 hypothetical protein CAOG_00371 [Capsaspora owczarzaki ATCC 30864]